MTINFSSDDLLRALHTMSEDELFTMMPVCQIRSRANDFTVRYDQNHWAVAIDYGRTSAHGPLSQETLERVRAGLKRLQVDSQIEWASRTLPPMYMTASEKNRRGEAVSE